MALPVWLTDDLKRSLRVENYDNAALDDADPAVAAMMNHGRSKMILPKRGEEIFEGTDYPRDWSGFVGQTEAKEQLQVQVASAKARGVRIEHTLLASGAHGVGKSTLATLLAAQAGAGILQTTGPLDAAKAKRMILSMRDGDVLFIDEVHTLVAGGKAKAEWLLPFMTEGKLYTDEGAIDCPDIAIVAATTDVGRLPETIISRFMVKPKLVAYTDDEAALIVRSLAERMGVDLLEEDEASVARAASGNPRDMRSILTAVRDLRLAFPDSPVDLSKAFRWAGFSYDGLSQTAREILLLLRTQTNHTASLDSMQALLGEPGPLRHHEQTLMQRGLLTVTGRGRQLTDAGVARAEQLVREEF